MPSKKSKRKQRRALSESDVNLGTRRTEGARDKAEVHALSESDANPETRRAEEAGDEAKLQALSESVVNLGTSRAEGAGDEAKLQVLSKRDDDLGTRTTEDRGAEAKAHGQSETPFTQNIHVASKIVQVGAVNTIINQKRNQDDTPKEACPSRPSSREPKKSYAQAVSGDVKSVNVSSKEIHVQAENVNITNVLNTGTGIPNTDKSSLSATTPKSQKEQAASFLEAVDRFDRGDFILVTGKQTELRYTGSLTLIKWTAILDFDPQSRTTGLLSSVESTLNKRRSLHIGSIQDQFNFSEHITNWIFMMGCADRPNTRTETEAGAWKKEINNEIDKQISLLKGFETCYTHFKFIVLWPSDTNTANCMNFILSKICTQMVSSVIIVDTCTDKSETSSSYLNILKQENEVTLIELGVKEMCQAINKVFANVTTETTNFRLPTKDKSSDPGISEQQAQWLREDFEILYIENKTGVEYNSKQLEKETDTFQRGGTLPWTFWYAGGVGQADIERDVTQSIVNRIKQVYIDYCTSGIITILHSPGSGGTTLSQRVLWTLKDMVPCAQMKQNSLSSVNDLVEKISCLSDRTNMPVVLLLDGEDENRILSLRRLFEREKICVIMIYVRRHCGDFDHYEESTGSDIFWLKENLSKREAANLKMKNARIKNDKRQKNVEQLVEDVENDKQRSIFEFGLAAHSYEYEGIQAYVRSHLRLPETSDTPLDPWQTSLAYLSLVYFYGHTSLPCNFFTTILGQSNGQNFILKKDELPQEMHEFIVKGENEARKNTVRISHYYIAKEILDQVLTRSSIIERSVSPYICNEAKKLLGTLSTGFIEKARIVCNGNVSDMISKIMINTFITRKHRDTFEDETQERRITGSKRPMFSHVLEDASSCAPFLERFNILEKLVASFPKEAQFRAHLGRLYVKCLPEEEQKAEENLRVAHEMSTTILDGNQNIDEIPFSKRLDIRNICHMYGNMLSQKVFKYTGKSSKDRPFISITQDQFHAIAKSLLTDVQKACSLFLTNRDVMSPGNEDCLGFVGEIHVRLMFCRFIKENGGHNSLEAFADNNDDNLGEFVNECFANIKNLFEGMCETADAQNFEVNGQPLQEMYIDIMESSAPSCISCKSDANTPRARRIEIGKLMNRYCSNRSCDFLEKLKEENELNFVVGCYEKNFETDYLSDKDLENDYRQWLRAIRHPAFSQRYSIDKVLTIVQNWYEHSQHEINPKRKINAKFYNFVLSSVVGFGHFGSSGNLELLRKSQILRKELREMAKYLHCPENQIEWLGPALSTIDRLIPGKRRFGDYDQTSLSMKQQESLEIRVGTILPPNTKPHSGRIALDLGSENRENITIHFVPRKWGMNGTAFKSYRVEFVIGFNIWHGYEAFLVKGVRKVKCKNDACCNQVERRSCDKTVTCPKCLHNTAVKSV